MKKLFCIALCTLLVACSNPEEDAKKLGFSDVAEMTALQKEGFKTKSEYIKKMEEDARRMGFINWAEMKDIQSKGFKNKDEYNSSLLSAAKIYAKCTAQIGILKQIAENNGLQSKAAQAHKLLQGLVFIQEQYTSSIISKEEIRKLISAEYNAYKTEIEAANINFEFVDRGIYDCEKQYLPKINEACRGKESICYSDSTASDTAGGLSKSQWISRCEAHARARNECSGAPKINSCVEGKMGQEAAYMANTYCSNGIPNFSLMGFK